MDDFKVGDRVVLARPDGFDARERRLSGGEVGAVARIADNGWLWVKFDGTDMPLSFPYHQLDLLESTTPQQRDDRRERIATAVLAGFAANLYTGEVPQSAARAAVLWADALIEEMSK